MVKKGRLHQKYVIFAEPQGQCWGSRDMLHIYDIFSRRIQQAFIIF